MTITSLSTVDNKDGGRAYEALEETIWKLSSLLFQMKRMPVEHFE